MSDKGFKILVGSGVLLIIIAFLCGAIIPELGDGERLGIVVYTRKASHPQKTLVWMRYYTTDGIIAEDSFARIYYGWHDFELGQLYRIRYHRQWNQVYKRITSIEVVEVG